MPSSFFAGMRRSGFDIGVSNNKLSKIMLEVLYQLPTGMANLKGAVVAHMGMVGHMAKSRDLNAAWETTKRQAFREHPERFLLEGKILRWNTGQERPTSKRLSAPAQRKLAALATKEGLSADDLLSRLLASYKATKRTP